MFVWPGLSLELFGLATLYPQTFKDASDQPNPEWACWTSSGSRSAQFSETESEWIVHLFKEQVNTDLFYGN